MNKDERSAASTGADSDPHGPNKKDPASAPALSLPPQRLGSAMEGLAEYLRDEAADALKHRAPNAAEQLIRWASEVEALRQRPGAPVFTCEKHATVGPCSHCAAESQRPGAQAASEQYPIDWKRVVLMVSPTGELHSIGGDNDAPAGAESCHPGFERIKTFWVRATPAGERPAQAAPAPVRVAPTPEGQQ